MKRIEESPGAALMLGAVLVFVGLLLSLSGAACVIASPAATTEVRRLELDMTIGPARIDSEGRIIRISTRQLPDCAVSITDRGLRYCSVAAQLDTLGRSIPLGSYVICTEA